MRKISTLLVDDHAVMRMGLVSLLESTREVTVAGDVGKGAEGIVQALKLRPDVVILDLMMPGMDGIETTRRLLREWPEARVLILTTFETSDGINQAPEAGAKGAILKSAELKDLLDAIRTVNAGKTYLSSEIRQIMKDDPPVPELSARQQELLDSLVRGMTNSDIAGQLGISMRTVKDHFSALFAKLGVANRTEAVALALRKQLLKM